MGKRGEGGGGGSAPKTVVGWNPRGWDEWSVFMMLEKRETEEIERELTLGLRKDIEG